MLCLLLLFVLSMISSALCDCPPAEYIAPACMCRDMGDGPMMMCSNLMSAEELVSPIKATDNLNMFSLIILDSTLLYIPSKIFVNTKFERILFSNSQIMALSDADLAFVGLEDHLEELRASGAHYITQWDWAQLKNHRRLELIDIHLISMYSLDHEFPELESLTSLGISKAEISFIHPQAFRNLKNLRRLIMKDNEITEMRRSMLPFPVNLYMMDLSGNQLSSLPEDMFTGMPELKELELNNNQFIILNEDTFRWPFENLQTLMLNGNDLRCDCRMRWIVDINKPMYFKATCAKPDSLNGEALQNLHYKVLWC